jgi:hypothetical protein
MEETVASIFRGKMEAVDYVETALIGHSGTYFTY